MRALTTSRQTTQNLTSERAREMFLSETKFQTPSKPLKDTLADVADFVAQMAADFRGDNSVCPHWLTLSGVSGCGKTMLVREVFAFADRHLGGVYNRTAQCMQPSRLAFQKIVNMVDDWRDGVYRRQADEEADLLIIDDIGAERDGTGFVKGKLFDLLERRLGKWTILTTNLKLRSIQDNYDVRIASRIIRDGNIYRPVKSGDWWLSAAQGEG